MVSSFDYTNDELGRRTARSDYYINRGSTETNTFGYNTFSEVTNANMGTNTYSYACDPIGNRDHCTIDNGQLIMTNVYTANGLNQYTNITGGIATVPVHDLDRNLASFNGWAYVWNGENRLILASNVEYVVTFGYDHQSRCIEKAQHKGTETRSLSFVLDDFNIISETLSTNNSSFIPHNSSFYTWGLDLSGTLQGAGGVGGLLAEIQDGTPYFTAFDANGNVTEYISANGAVEAHREYSAFGETLVSTGAKKDDFTHWWSTKPFDPVTGFSEYEYRKYLPPIGRWLNRDPIGEIGGLNLYGMTRNRNINEIDINGLFWYDVLNLIPGVRTLLALLADPTGSHPSHKRLRAKKLIESTGQTRSGVGNERAPHGKG
ncbi:MAG: RHS repeat-associated core domain-containing protein [Kiritimatiellae bacterium]|nr:RHS repeat-associated core domain-containing protein [Kiritimatiellia bacterium]